MSRVDEVFQTTEGTVYTNGNGEANLKSWAGRTIYEHNGMQDPKPYQQEHDELFDTIRAGNVIEDTEMGYVSTLAASMGRTATYTDQDITSEDMLKYTELLVPYTMT